MPSVIEAPDFIVEEQDDQIITKRPSTPSTKPRRSALRRALRALVGRDDTRNQTPYETAIDRLARQEPYLYIRAICG